MKLHILIALLFSALAVSADIPKEQKVFIDTNDTKLLKFKLTGDTNLLDAETLNIYIEELKRKGGTIIETLSETVDNLNALERIFETGDKLQAMFKDATNILEFSFAVDSKRVTVMIVNPSMSASGNGQIIGKYYVLYPEEWRVVELSYDLPKLNSNASRYFTIKRKVASSFELWRLDLLCPFDGMKRKDRRKVMKELKIFTGVPLERVSFEPGIAVPVWIADYGTSSSDDKEDKK